MLKNVVNIILYDKNKKLVLYKYKIVLADKKTLHDSGQTPSLLIIVDIIKSFKLFLANAKSLESPPFRPFLYKRTSK